MAVGGARGCRPGEFVLTQCSGRGLRLQHPRAHGRDGHRSLAPPRPFSRSARTHGSSPDAAALCHPFLPGTGVRQRLYGRTTRINTTRNEKEKCSVLVRKIKSKQQVNRGVMHACFPNLFYFLSLSIVLVPVDRPLPYPSLKGMTFPHPPPSTEHACAERLFC